MKLPVSPSRVFGEHRVLWMVFGATHVGTVADEVTRVLLEVGRRIL